MIDNEIFLIKDGDNSILYAPLIHFSAIINEACVASVSRRLNGEKERDEDKEIIEKLVSFGLFDKVSFSDKEVFCPTDVTVFPTDGCNMKCIYCYASSGKVKKVLPLQTGYVAIDYVIKNAKKIGKNSITVKFHGSGEPLTAFETVKSICEYAKSEAKKNNLSVSLMVVSNGFWSEEILYWVIDNIDEIAISFDGIESVQNRQRPAIDGGNSYKTVSKTLCELNRYKKSFGIKVTITDQSLKYIVDIAENIVENYPECKWLQFEPVWSVGRFLHSDENEPCAEAFIKEFIRADRLYGDKTEIIYATSQIDNIKTSFCEMPNNQFILTPDGLVTSCYEVFDKNDSRASIFVYGKFDEYSKQFIIDNEKVENLHKYSVLHNSFCKNCFCKYHCAGDCPAKILGTKSIENFEGSIRCKITREITKYKIIKNLSD